MKPEAKNCQSCQSDFRIEPEDFDFYRKIDVPPPTWCPECRLQRRLTWRNERAFYKRKCDLCEEEIMAMHPADAPYPVYCRPCWFSDKWDGTDYGREYDFSRNFFEQFRELLNQTPQIALQVSNCVNCEYANQIANCKNCYLITSGSGNEDCMYSFRILDSKNVVDSTYCRKLEYCFECLQCNDSSKLFFSQGCTDSVDLSFCYDVRGSNDCFMSSNLRRASYVFRNKQLAKEEYLKEVGAIDFGSHETILNLKQEFKELKLNSLHKYVLEKNTVDFSGNSVSGAKNCHYCFVGSELENCKYSLMIANAKDTHDVNNGCCVMELNYEVSTMGVNAYNVRLSADIWPEARNITYSQSCRDNSRDLFGCVSLSKKEYCVLNKQYSKEEYESLVGKIIQQMDEKPYKDAVGRVYGFGEFFPPELSLFAYNESPAQDFFPLKKEEASVRGFRWRDFEKKNYAISLRPESLPDNVTEALEEINKEIIGCEHEADCNHQCTVAFRITPQELDFYKRIKVALPRLCPNCRHHQRLEASNPFKLWTRQCMCNSDHRHHPQGRCSNEFQTSYALDRPETVYCEECYQAEVV